MSNPNITYIPYIQIYTDKILASHLAYIGLKYILYNKVNIDQSIGYPPHTQCSCYGLIRIQYHSSEAQMNTRIWISDVIHILIYLNYRWYMKLSGVIITIENLR